MYGWVDTGEPARPICSGCARAPMVAATATIIVNKVRSCLPHPDLCCRTFTYSPGSPPLTSGAIRAPNGACKHLPHSANLSSDLLT